MVQDRQLSVEAVGGGAIAMVALLLWRGKTFAPAALAGMLAIAIGFTVAELAPGSGALQAQFNWIPLVGQMHSLSGLESILEVFWPFFTLAFFARGVSAPYRRQGVSIMGGVAVAAVVFVLEWMQLDLPGRYGDISQVLLALAGWTVPWMLGTDDYAIARTPERQRSRRTI